MTIEEILYSAQNVIAKNGIRGFKMQISLPMKVFDDLVYSLGPRIELRRIWISSDRQSEAIQLTGPCGPIIVLPEYK